MPLNTMSLYCRQVNTDLISGTTAIILGVLAVVFVATSFMSFCPLYLPFGISTTKKS